MYERDNVGSKAWSVVVGNIVLRSCIGTKAGSTFESRFASGT